MRFISITGDIVAILVGPEAERITVHEPLVRSRSQFFNAALDKAWQEAQERCIRLPDDKYDIVMLYCQYLYSGKIYLVPTVSKQQISPDGTPPEYHTLAKLYVFGEKIRDVKVKNAVLDAIISRKDEAIEGLQYNPAMQTVNIIYEGTMPGSPARRLMVDNHVRGGKPAWLFKDSTQNNKEFLTDLARALLSNPNPSWKEGLILKSKYHEGDGGDTKQ